MEQTAYQEPQPIMVVMVAQAAAVEMPQALQEQAAQVEQELQIKALMVEMQETTIQMTIIFKQAAEAALALLVAMVGQLLAEVAVMV